MDNTTYDWSALNTTAVVIGGIIAIAIWLVFLSPTSRSSAGPATPAGGC